MDMGRGAGGWRGVNAVLENKGPFWFSHHLKLPPSKEFGKKPWGPPKLKNPQNRTWFDKQPQIKINYQERERIVLATYEK